MEGTLSILLFLVSISSIRGEALGDLNPDIEGRIVDLCNCKEATKEMPMEYKNVTIKKVGKNEYTIEGYVITQEIIEGPLQIDNKVFQCKDQNFKKCQEYTSMKNKDGCEELAKGKGQMKDIMEKTNASDAKCPLPKDTYHMSPCKLKLPKEAGAFEKMSHYWKVDGFIKRENTLVMCYNVKIELFKAGEQKNEHHENRNIKSKKKHGK